MATEKTRSFHYTVSQTGSLEAYEYDPAEEDDSAEFSIREYYTREAATTLAIARMREAIQSNTSITGGDNLRKKLGDLETNPDAVFKTIEDRAQALR